MQPDTALTSLSALREHVAAEGKGERYAELLERLGIDLERWPPLSQHPCPVLFEQPGSWFGVEDLARAELLEALPEHLEVDQRSGPWTLGCDGFTVSGLKGTATRFALHPGFGTVSWIAARAARRSRHRTYASLGFDRERCARLLDLAAQLLEAAESRRFSDAVLDLRRRALPPFLRRLLPSASSRAQLDDLGLRLRRYELVRARARLGAARSAAESSSDWIDFWTRVNRDWLGVGLRRGDELLQRALLAVRDPGRTTRALSLLIGAEAGSLPLAAIVTEHDEYRMVHYQPEGDRCWIQVGPERLPTTWDEVLAHAAAGRSGGPAALLEYLLLAAAGLYLVSTCYDGRCSYERHAYSIHLRLTGLRFPVIVLDDDDLYSGYFLDLHCPRWRARRRAAIARFLDGAESVLRASTPGGAGVLAEWSTPT